MKISEASKIAGVSKRTLQYYDDEGLLSVKRMENNHRDYDLESLQIIWKILNLKEMGFELEEIRRLLVQDRISFDEKKEEIRKKENKLVGQNKSLGTTPRRIVDLVGSLCDLTSGSGDKGTPVVYIQGYFDNFAND